MKKKNNKRPKPLPPSSNGMNGNHEPLLQLMVMSIGGLLIALTVGGALFMALIMVVETITGFQIINNIHELFGN